MNVLFVASECAPFVKTGGLAGVIGAVPKALAQLGLSVRVLLPAYPALEPQIKAGVVIQHFPDLFGGAGQLVAVSSEGLDLLLLDAPHLFNRQGSIYLDSMGIDWRDNHLRSVSRHVSLVCQGATSYVSSSGLGSLSGCIPLVIQRVSRQVMALVSQR